MDEHIMLSCLSGIPIFLVLTVTGAVAMSDTSKSFVCSPMQCSLVDAAGKPASGVRVTRKWGRCCNKVSDETVTDAQDHFAFDGVEAKRGSFLAASRLKTRLLNSSLLKVRLMVRRF